jgi:hypothetical protein
MAEPICEGKAALAEWNEHTAAVIAPRDALLNASSIAAIFIVCRCVQLPHCRGGTKDQRSLAAH